MRLRAGGEAYPVNSDSELDPVNLTGCAFSLPLDARQVHRHEPYEAPPAVVFTGVTR